MLDRLPTIQGVSPSCVLLPAQHSASSIFEFLCKKFSHIEPHVWTQRFAQARILDEYGHPLSIETPYRPNLRIYYYRELAHEIPVPFKETILFEHEHLLAIDKPHFLAVTPTGQYVQETLLTRLKQHYLNPDLSPIHRLDRETAGVILFSKQPETRHLYQKLFMAHQVTKTYHAIAPYAPWLEFPLECAYHMQKGDPFYTMKIYPDQKANSWTTIECLEHNTKWAKYQLFPKSGKQHQLRVHLNALGIPIRHDPLYPQVIHKQAGDFNQPLQLLAKSIAFFDPILKQRLQLESPQSLNLDRES